MTGNSYYPIEDAAPKDGCVDSCALNGCCCGCCSLRTGAIIILVLTLIGNVGNISQFASSSTLNALPLCAGILGLLINAAGLYAVVKEKKQLLKWFTIANFVLLVVSVVAVIVSIVLMSTQIGKDMCMDAYKDEKLPKDYDLDRFCRDVLGTLMVSAGIGLSISTLINVYCILVLWSYYRFLCKNQRVAVSYVPVNSHAPPAYTSKIYPSDLESPSK
ncbi:hypothetical protein MP638_007245 [Amoeboaphelidium occidentale]|nr:hypothetical protein MP638_007245 [Amoeboaphelidium occidentale]